LTSRAGIEAGVAWLSEDLLLVKGDGVAGEPGAVVHRVPLEASDDGSELTITVGDRSFVVERKTPGTAASDLSALLRSGLSGLGPDARRELLDSIVAACAPQLESGASTTLSRNLRLVRDALREPLPSASIRDEPEHGLDFDELLGVDERSFWASGWLSNAATASEITMVSPEGGRAAIAGSMLHYERPDLGSSYAGHHGFVSLFELEVPSRLEDGWIAELLDSSGNEVEAELPPVNAAPLEVRELIPRALRDVLGDKHAFVCDFAYPALARVQARIATSVDIETIIQCGDPAPAPDITIVVPLRDRFDALEHQLCQFSRDPDLVGSDLIYVLDSVEDADELAPKASELHEIYGVPFRLTALSGTAGTTVMVKRAVSLARGGRLLLLNPDVVPDRAGWLRGLSAFYDSQPGIGAVAPMLLYEDESIQHAGLKFEPASPQELAVSRAGEREIWETRSRFKGLPGSLAEASEAKAVPVVSGACLMIDRNLFEDSGELRNIYAEGQNESTDLCLRLLETGHSNWYLPDVRMYYLEGRSELEPSLYARQYNALLLSHLWDERIRLERESSLREPLAT
jgi:hypothetical protein